MSRYPVRAAKPRDVRRNSGYLYAADMQYPVEASNLANTGYPIYALGMVAFAEQVKELRDVTGWSQQRLAKELGRSRFQTVSEWEKGRSTPPRDIQEQVRMLLKTHQRLDPQRQAEEQMLRSELQGMMALLGVDDLRELHTEVMKKTQQQLAERLAVNGEAASGDRALGRVRRLGSDEVQQQDDEENDEKRA